MGRGFVFAMEALLGLLVFAALFAAIGGVEKNAEGAGFARIAKQQALQDLLEVGVRNYGREMVEFSRGNESAKNFLQEKYAALVPRLGNFCFKLFFESGSSEQPRAFARGFIAGITETPRVAPSNFGSRRTRLQPEVANLRPQPKYVKTRGFSDPRLFIEANCENNAARENGEVLGAHRILYGGENFFEVRAELS